MKIIFDRPITLDGDLILCAINHDVVIEAPLTSLTGCVKILGKTVFFSSCIVSKKETCICGSELTQTTKESKIFSETNIIIGSGEFPTTTGCFGTPGLINLITIIK